MFLQSYRTPVRYARYQDDPFTSMHRALNRTLEEFVGGASVTPATQAAALSVRLDVKEDEKAFQVTADLPGLSEQDVEVTFDDGVLTIRGEKKLVRDEKKDTWHVVERSYGSFARQLALPTNIDADKIEAKFEKGVLHVTLPKQAAEQIAAKKITIKSS